MFFLLLLNFLLVHRSRAGCQTCGLRGLSYSDNSTSPPGAKRNDTRKKKKMKKEARKRDERTRTEERSAELTSTKEEREREEKRREEKRTKELWPPFS